MEWDGCGTKAGVCQGALGGVQARGFGYDDGMATEPGYFRVCSTCRKPIEFGQKWYRCSVSTCNRGNTALFFCSVGCWSAHVPVVRHRDAWAEQETAPTREAWQAEVQATRDSGASGEAAAPAELVLAPDDLPKDILVVVSKVKAYIRARSGFNTSDGAMDVISDHLRELCVGAIRNAAADGRKTVMDRDFRPLVRQVR